jgi:4-methylaminobutanoate oxidase (formaldehyde-forming)
VFSTRIEKGYRLWGSDTTPDHTPAESGLGWTLSSKKDFLGRDAALEAPVRTRVVTLRFDDPDSVVYGWEPVLLNGEVIGRIAGGEYGYSVGAFIAHAIVDAGHTAVGTEVTVRRTGEPHRAEIVEAPLWDPTSQRLKS